MELKEGQIVDIYQLPFTLKKFEGRAKLVKMVRRCEMDGYEDWQVEFVDEPGDTYIRTICY